MVSSTKKLIEVALPLDAINAAATKEKSIRHGHPSTLHLWWARRPLAAARAVIFAQMVDDPSEYVDLLLADPVKKRAAQRALTKLRAKHQGCTQDTELDHQALGNMAAQIERDRLFSILEELVLWKNTTNQRVLAQARSEIWQSWRRACAKNAGHGRATELFDRHRLPAFHDPFAGGGALPLEAQRLGLEAHASDLNPVAVLINKAMIEIPPKFCGRPPLNPKAQQHARQMSRVWTGAQGLAEDVRYYGNWMREVAQKRIGQLYPAVEITPEIIEERPDLKQYLGRKLSVIAWLWVRTVRSPNPAFADVEVPLASTFTLSTKKGREAYVEPVIEGRGYQFTVKVGKPSDAEMATNGTSAGKRRAFRCLMSRVPLPYEHVRTEGKAGRLGSRLMAVVAEGNQGRVYLPPLVDHETIAWRAHPTWKPDCEMPKKHRNFQGPVYGLENVGDLFTPRQLVALSTFAGLVGEAIDQVRRDAVAAGIPNDGQSLRDGGIGASAYAEAVGVYLACAVDYAANYWSVIATPADGFIRGTFSRQALPMTWDFAEAPPFGNTSGNWLAGIEWISRALELLPWMDPGNVGTGFQADAASHKYSLNSVFSTDPPYYDNIAYADLSDFFYVWLRRVLRPIFPELFATLAVPKTEELVASSYRHGSKVAAEAFFLDGMTQALQRLAEHAHPGFPVTVYYAFKQSETTGESGTVSTGWETFLDAVMRAGFAITGTWPIRTERGRRPVSIGTNALASSIVLVCRVRPRDAKTVTRREFLSALRSELPQALHQLQTGNVAPVDLAQTAIGPGMAVYTRYAQVVDASGRTVSVRDALALINQSLDQVLAEQEGDFDADSRWALAWFEQHGFGEGDYGTAEILSKAKNTSVAGMVDAGIVASRGGTVRLLTPKEMSDDWNPASDTRLTTWEAVHHLIRLLETQGERGAAEIASGLGGKADVVRELCYRLFRMCEQKKRAAEALSYNSLVQSWPEIIRLARASVAQQSQLFDGPA